MDNEKLYLLYEFTVPPEFLKQLKVASIRSKMDRVSQMGPGPRGKLNKEV
jgi:hypothetical protein